MNNPGSYVLCAQQITAALSAQAQTAIENLEGMLACSIVARFVYGSGGLTAVALIQTTLDDVNWIDIARFDFTTASAVKYANLSGLTYKAAAALSSLGSEGQNDGILGEQIRAVITTTGTYGGGTLLDLRMVAR
ncbi:MULTISPECIES: hypothetical protein [unclassified Mesorhizobium]|uniref:hypothetical protein n=1 Tax=unclassified Mesorhizobium TaxID=325217 RepID=UPI000FD7AAA1|nr:MULTISPECIES: hypothetical protein [unclassified Mesorhizobium]TGT76716.1 hypothetical protein EN809_003680 [Mesorhizobium sp. M2E.F.Ca.ET.166.01.1.1]TGW02828.1 hypothetical protein EN797_003680 [Mesorhizobium sp. M2E.F.Ca.ET.154.01.1.1]